MAAQADRLLVHGDLVREDGGLGQDAALVDGLVLQDLPHLLLQALAVIGDSLGVQLLHLGHQLQDGGGAAAQVVLQGQALRHAHGVVSLQGQLHHTQQIRLQLILVSLGLIHHEHIAHAGQGADADVVLDAVLGHHLPHGGEVALENGLVQCHLHIRLSLGADGDVDIHLAPGDGGLDRGLDGLLGEGEAPGQLDGAV